MPSNFGETNIIKRNIPGQVVSAPQDVVFLYAQELDWPLEQNTHSGLAFSLHAAQYWFTVPQSRKFSY